MLSILFIVAREFLEAALIIGIIAAFLKKQGLATKGGRFLWSGVAGGVILSGLLAFALYNLGEWLDGRGLLYFEAGLFILSAILMTQMVFWMRSIGTRMKGHLEAGLSESFGRSGFLGIAAITALGIGREGAEVATYIYSLSLSGQYQESTILIAFALGLFIALLIYWSLSRGMGYLKMSNFFHITSIFLFLAAGALLIEASARLTELDILPSIIPVLWNSNHWLPADSWLGQVLAVLVGYKPMPSLMMVLVYVSYWILIGLTYFRPLWINSRQAPQANY